MTITEQNTYRLGVAYVAVSAFLWSLSGLFMRAIETDLMTILFLRGLVSGTLVFVLFLVVERGKVWAILKAMGWPTFWAAGMIVVRLIVVSYFRIQGGVFANVSST